MSLTSSSICNPANVGSSTIVFSPVTVGASTTLLATQPEVITSVLQLVHRVLTRRT